MSVDPNRARSVKAEKGETVGLETEKGRRGTTTLAREQVMPSLSEQAKAELERRTQRQQNACKARQRKTKVRWPVSEELNDAVNAVTRER